MVCWSENEKMNKKIDRLIHYKKIHNLETSISKQEYQLLIKNTPIQKIVGFINFDNLEIKVNQKVLIPRFETQELVNKAMTFLTSTSKVLDLGCGSGYIGLTIKQQINCDVTMSDIDQNAIEQTLINAQLNGLKVKVIKSDMFEMINDKFDLIVSNPPYIPNNVKLSKCVLNFEPSHALFGGDDGNYYYRKIIEKAPQFLNQNGILVLEMSADNQQYLLQSGFEIFEDINGKARIAVKKY